jgi:hypothetical protein
MARPLDRGANGSRHAAKPREALAAAAKGQHLALGLRPGAAARAFFVAASGRGETLFSRFVRCGFYVRDIIAVFRLCLAGFVPSQPLSCRTRKGQWASRDNGG